MDVLQNKPIEQPAYKTTVVKRKRIISGSVKSCLKLSSSACALVGGIMVASNTHVSGHGFLLLVLSSSQLLVSSILDRDFLLICYSGSVFFFVDCLGVYRWLLS